MQPPVRTRFNAKARSSSAGGSSHKRKKSAKVRNVALNSNAQMIVPGSAEEQARKDLERRRRELLAAVGADSSAPISSKKRKRLDAYIESRLKKEERVHLLAKLAQSSTEVDRTELKSAATLGTGRAKTGAERIETAGKRELLSVLKGKRRRRGTHALAEEDDLNREGYEDDEDDPGFHSAPEDMEEENDGPVGEVMEDADRRARIIAAASMFAKPEDATAVGSALALGLDGKPVMPTMKKRKPKNKKKQTGRLPGSGTAWGRSAHASIKDSDDDTDSSFDSSESGEDESKTARKWDQENTQVKDEDDDKDASEDPETDTDEEDIIFEAMRRREMLKEDAKEDEAPADLAEADASSPSYQGFGDEDDSQDGSEEEEDSDKDDSDDSDDEAEPRSRRRGIGQSSKSRGFKEWARSALGMSGDAEQTNTGEEDHSYNLEPVGGYKVKVSDLMPKDGVARGPLGKDEERLENKSPFAAKFYAELKQTAEDGESSTTRKLRNVQVIRDEDLTAARLRLPVVADEENIVRTIMENPVTVICGETGSGKTTQVPQFLYEAAFGHKDSYNPGMIGITQPRRVAAISMAQRVASELSLPPTKVSHQIRYDATVSPLTAIKFMTDGVLLRELATDLLLSKYSAIMVDEAHERSVNTDVLIGVLSRVVRLREQRWLEGAEGARPLRLIIMSATLRVSDFTLNTTLFPMPPPVININARQHPVTVHFNRRTVQDYLAEAVKKTTKIHARLPPGGILVFLTGQQEITTVCRRLEKRFGRKAIERKRKERQRARDHRRKKNPNQDDDDEEEQPGEKVRLAAKDGDVEAEELDLGISKDLALDVDDGVMDDQDPDALDTDDEDAKEHDADLPEELKDDIDVPMHILPLYSLLSSDKQMRIFAKPPSDARLVVVATNVAETSLTIPNIKYVVDCGRCKERKYDLLSGVQSYEVSWISKASASQRAGRAGRTGPGHCYRLYSSAVFEDHFESFSSPEILRTPVEGLVLSMKAMNIDNVSNFPFPTPPDHNTIRRAEKTLTYLGALEPKKLGRGATNAQVTELGRSMTLFPVTPRFSKMLAQGQQHGCLPYVIALVAALSVGDPFVREQLLEEASDEELEPENDYLTNPAEIEKERKKALRKRYFTTMRKFEALGAGLSDTFRLLSVVGAYEYENGGTAFCERNFLRPKAMEEIHKLRAQLCNLVASNVPKLATLLEEIQLAPPNETQLKVIRQLIASAYIDQVAVRADLISNTCVTSSSISANSDETNQMLCRLRSGGDKMSSTRGVPYKAMGVAGFAFIHPTSTFFHHAPPAWIVFSELQKSSAKVALAKEGTVWLKTLTKVNPAWLSSLGRALCTFSKPVEGPGTGGLAASAKAVKITGEAKRTVILTPTYAVGPEEEGMAGGLGWELPSVKATQTLEKGRWVTHL